MIEINLLPGGAQKRPAAARRPGAGVALPRLGGDPRIAGLGGAAVLLLALSTFWFWTSGQKIASLEAQVTREVQDSVRLERSIALMKTLDTRKDTIDQKIEVIREVDVRRYVWPHLMDEVSRATPPFMWLTKMAVLEDEGADAAPAATPAAAPADTAKARADSVARASAQAEVAAGPSFNVEGNAGSTQALTRFMRNLEASPMIRDVALITSEQIDFQGRSVLKFSLEARWEQPDPSLIETVPLLNAR
ncbi:PilN domain-containing protein [Longimicrobium sp.]|uniref:PilN domain-containing protein n=1 Tax=Longimicrobium sp. TaxID=2029185 RepID=UPI002F936F7D